MARAGVCEQLLRSVEMGRGEHSAVRVGAQQGTVGGGCSGDVRLRAVVLVLSGK